MSIKPVDLQIMYPKMTKVSKDQADEQQKSHSQMQQSTSTTKSAVEGQLSTVHKKDKIEETKIREKQEKNKQQKGKNKNQKDKDQNKDDNSTIDIRL